MGEGFNCQAWDKLAETCNQYLAKGKQLYLQGRLESRTYQTQAGETGLSNDINLTEVQLPGCRGRR